MAEEEFRATWHKRFMQRHYSYRDAHSVTTVPLSESAMLALIAAGLAATPPTIATTVYYVFGTNARSTVNPLVAPFGTPYGVVAWPATCYARNVLVLCTEDAYIKIVSLNPAYLRQVTQQAYTRVSPTTSQLIFEVEEPLLAGNWHRFFPTYGYGIAFRAPAGGSGGTLTIEVGGNVEGGE